MGRYGYSGFAPYVPVAERKRKAAMYVAKLKKKGQLVQPVIVEGRIIAKTFWGKAWCDNLEAYSDYANRLPRGRTYVRNGSVVDLKILAGEITALVSGSSMYTVKINIKPVSSIKWKSIVTECSGKIDSIVELLQGKLSKAVMAIITHPENGLFPRPKEIKLNCSCPDWADMCKHVAAVLYGVGARLDESPNELFLLRHADQSKLIAKAGKAALINPANNEGQEFASSDLSELFGIDIEDIPQKNVNKKKGAAQKNKHTSAKHNKNKIKITPVKIVKAKVLPLKKSRKNVKGNNRT